MKIIPLLATLSLSAFIATGCGTDSLPLVGGPDFAKGDICNVGDNGHVTKAQHDSFLKQAQSAGAKLKAKDKKQLLGQIILSAAYYDAAVEEGVKVSDKDVNARIKQIKESLFQGDEKKYKAELKRQGLSETQLRRQIKEQMVLEKMIEKVAPKEAVSDKEIAAYYKDHKAEFAVTKGRTIAHILVKTQKEANALAEQVKNGADFAKLAKKNSIDPSSKDAGGVLSVKAGQLPKELEKAVFSAKLGETVVVKSQFGWHVLQARTGITKATQQTLKEATPLIKERLKNETRQGDFAKWQTKVQKDLTKDDIDCKEGYSYELPKPATASVKATTKKK